MKKLVLALAATTFMSTAALAEDIKIGVFLGFTGPIESTVAHMRPGAELAIKEVPDSGEIEEFRQPIVRVSLICPSEYIGPVMQLCIDRRGVQVRTEYLSTTRAMLSSGPTWA